MSTTSKEWHSAPGMISDKLYRVSSQGGEYGKPQMTWLEVQHVPGVSEWVPEKEGTSVLISRLRGIADYHHGSRYFWYYMGGRGGNTQTLARLNDDDVAYEISTDEGATWRETDHPFALAKRILELDPA